MPAQPAPLVLVADDDVGHRAMMRLALESFEFRIAEAENGRQVLNSFDELEPDILLLDVMMPGADGYEVCRKIRRHPKGKLCPVVMVTGLEDINSINRAYDIGATDFITKPINWAVLGHRVRYILRASHAESELTKAHIRLMDAVECFPAAFQIFDENDRLALCNSRSLADNPQIADRLNIGITRAEVLRSLAESGVVVEAVGHVEEWVAEMLARADDPAMSVYDQQYSDGRWLKIVQRRTSSGGLVSLGIDITELKQREHSLRIAKDDAEAANRAKSEFFANVSHELRTPLNAIMGFSEVLKSEIFGKLGADRYRQYAADIFDSGQHLLGIINDLLDMSRIEAGQLRLCEERFSAAEIVAASIRLMKVTAERAQLRLTAEIPNHAPDLYGDARMVRQMLLNVCSNAIKFTPPRGRISVSMRRTDDQGLAISVEDTGIGIAANDLDTVLAPFGQIESAYSRKHRGTGLGLPLTKAMIELHGGSLELKSAPSVGSTVTLVFPRFRVMNEPIAAA